MKILVTGATSGLGRNAVQWLLEKGHQVIAVGRNPQAGAELQALGATFIAQDLTECTDTQFAQLVSGCDVVWHCAAKSSPWGNAQTFFDTNVIVTEKLTLAAGCEGVKRFVHISSPAVYFDFCHHDNLPETYQATRFSSHYASSKSAAEQVVQKSVELFPDTVYITLRPRGLFGPHDCVIVPRLLKQLNEKRNVLHLPGGGKALLDLTFVLNVVHAMDLATQRQNLRSGSVYNITNHQPQRLADMVDNLLNQQLNYNCRLQSLPYWLLHALASVMEQFAKISRIEPLLTRYGVGAAYFDMTLNPRRAIDELGYHPLYSLEEGIALTGEWLRAQGKGHHG